MITPQRVTVVRFTVVHHRVVIRAVVDVTIVGRIRIGIGIPSPFILTTRNRSRGRDW